MVWEVGQRYLENVVGTPLVYFEMFIGHGASLVFSIADKRGSPIVVNSSDMDAVLLKDIRCGYNLPFVGDLANKP